MMKNNLRNLFLSILFVLPSSSSIAQVYKSSIKVTVQIYEMEPRTKTVIPVTETGTENLKPPFWKIEDSYFRDLAKEVKELPESPDSAVVCPRNNVMIELLENNKVTIKFSCYNSSNSTRKKYLKFARKII